MTAEAPPRPRIARANLRERSLGLARHAGWPVHVCWPRFQRHVHGLLLPPELCESGTVLAWRWTEPGSPSPITGRELGLVRRRLEEAAAALSTAADDSAEDGELLRTIGQVVQGLATGPEARLEGFLCRSTQGIQVHSWGLAAPGTVADDASGGGVPERPPEVAASAEIRPGRRVGSPEAVGRAAPEAMARSAPLPWAVRSEEDEDLGAGGGGGTGRSSRVRRWLRGVWGGLAVIATVAGVATWQTAERATGAGVSEGGLGVASAPADPGATGRGRSSEGEEQRGAQPVGGARLRGPALHAQEADGARGRHAPAAALEDGRGGRDETGSIQGGAGALEVGFQSERPAGVAPTAGVGAGMDPLAPARGAARFRAAGVGSAGLEVASTPADAGAVRSGGVSGMEEGREVQPGLGPPRPGGTSPSGVGASPVGLDLATTPAEGGEARGGRPLPGEARHAAQPQGEARPRGPVNHAARTTPEGRDDASTPADARGMGGGGVSAGEERLGAQTSRETRPRGQARHAAGGLPEGSDVASTGADSVAAGVGGDPGRDPWYAAPPGVEPLHRVAVVRCEPARLDLVVDLPAPTEPEPDDGDFDPVAWHQRWREELRRRLPAELAEAVPWTGVRVVRAAGEEGPLRWSGISERSGASLWEETLGWRDAAPPVGPAVWLARDERGVVARLSREADGRLTIEVRPGTAAEICRGVATSPEVSASERLWEWGMEPGMEPPEWWATRDRSPWGWGPMVAWRVEATPRSGVTLRLCTPGSPWGWTGGRVARAR